MNLSKTLSFWLRISMGWYFFYASISKIMDPAWSAAGYLAHAQSLKGLFAWLASPSILPTVDFLNQWGLLLISISLLLGLFVRLSAWFGCVLMALYYFPVLNFPYAGEHGFIIDEHVIYIIVLLALANLGAGKAWGLDNWFSKLPFVKKSRYLKKLIG